MTKAANKYIYSSVLILILFINLILPVGCSTFGSSKKPVPNSLRAVEEIKLENGLTVLFIEEPSLPRISLNLLVGLGSQSDPIGSEGVANLTVDSMELGTSHRSATKLAEDLEYLGSELKLNTGLDSSSIGVHGLSHHQEDLLGIFSDVILNPAFHENEIQKKKKEIISQIEKIKDNPDALTELLFKKELFQGTRWASPAIGLRKSVEKIDRTEVIKTYFQYFRPNNAVLAVGGKFDQSFKDKVIKQFSSWQAKEVNVDIGTVLNRPSTTRIVFYHQPDLQQAQIIMGHASISRSHSDYLKYRISNFILGGNFSSRLNQSVRDDLGLTYSIASSVESFKDIGVFKIETFCAHEKIVKTIDETYKVFKKFKLDGVNLKELESTKNMMIGQFPGLLETVDSQAVLMASMRLYNVSDDYLKFYNHNVSMAKLADINDVILKGYYPDELVIVILADKEKVKGLENLPWPVEYKTYTGSNK